jgi:hypothetical protein
MQYYLYKCMPDYRLRDLWTLRLPLRLLLRLPLRLPLRLWPLRLPLRLCLVRLPPLAENVLSPITDWLALSDAKNCLSATKPLSCGIIDFTLNVEVLIKLSL